MVKEKELGFFKTKAIKKEKAIENKRQSQWRIEAVNRVCCSNLISEESSELKLED